jgi:hypothetical protein
VRAAALAVLAACSAPAKPRAAVSNATSPAAHDRTEHDLRLAGDCDLTDAERFPLDQAGHETVSIVGCYIENLDSADGRIEREYTAHLVRRSTSDTRGTSIELGSWIAAPEQVESYEIDALVRAADGAVTHVLVRHGKGGLDQIPDAEIRDYLPAPDELAATAYAGTEIRVEVAPGDTRATLTVCTLAAGGTYDQELSCAEQQGASTKTITIGP